MLLPVEIKKIMTVFDREILVYLIILQIITICNNKIVKNNKSNNQNTDYNTYFINCSLS